MTRPCLGRPIMGFCFVRRDNVKAEFPQYPAVEEYADLMALIDERL